MLELGRMLKIKAKPQAESGPLTPITGQECVRSV